MRSSDTYRGQRRNAWRDADVKRTWLTSNAEYGTAFDVGGRSHDREGNSLKRARMVDAPRSKYMPHQGKREMARRAQQLVNKDIGDTRSTARFGFAA